jgi:hypothetical protein
VKVLEKLAKEKNTSVTGIALAYVYAKVRKKNRGRQAGEKEKN